jgi:hypothetical protein
MSSFLFFFFFPLFFFSWTLPALHEFIWLRPSVRIHHQAFGPLGSPAEEHLSRYIQGCSLQLSSEVLNLTHRKTTVWWRLHKRGPKTLPSVLLKIQPTLDYLICQTTKQLIERNHGKESMYLWSLNRISNSILITGCISRFQTLQFLLVQAVIWRPCNVNEKRHRGRHTPGLTKYHPRTVERWISKSCASEWYLIQDNLTLWISRGLKIAACPLSLSSCGQETLGWNCTGDDLKKMIWKRWFEKDDLKKMIWKRRSARRRFKNLRTSPTTTIKESFIVLAFNIVWSLTESWIY